MRKILTSVLSVAGLLAVVLALASSPASAAKVVVTIQTEDPGTAGTYTVSWETQGGCDPGSGTSGASGSVTLTVADADGAGAGTTGPQQETGIVTDNICNYTYKATFTNAAGAACVVGGSTTADDATTGADLTVTAGTLGLATGACATTGRINVTVKGSPTTAAVICTQADVDDSTITQCTATTDVKTPAVASELNDGAASSTSFTITATPEKVAGKVPEGCNAVSEDTKTDYDDNSLQKATLTVTDVPLGGTGCVYTVTAELPAGFAAGDGSERSTDNSDNGVNPDGADTNTGPDGEAGTRCGTATATPECADNGSVNADDLIVSVASVKVYLVQNVIGDAGGASVEYKYTAPCGAPGLPGALKRVPASGGISSVDGKTLVELRTGRFNVSEALPDGTAENGTAANALDAKGKACEATVAVTGAPASCSVSSNSPATLASASGSVIIEVKVDCSPPPAPEPPAEEPMDDMGGDDMSDGGDDMNGADDMSGDDMGDMGPPEDTPTG